jgi:glycine/D-amino acid oxidase-like deaminating enzyme
VTAFDVVVVGGGIVGTSAAAFLSAAGASVLLVERDGLASGASGANAGVVWHPFDPVMVALYHETVALYRELANGSGSFRIGERPRGLLEVSTSERAARTQQAAIEAFYPELGATVLDEAALREAEPGIAAGYWGCRSELGYPIAPASSTYAYATLAEARGAVVRTGRAAALEIRGDGVIGVRIDGEPIAAGAVVAAAGPWTPALLDPTAAWTPIRPLWGVVAEVEMRAQTRHIVDEIGEDAAADTIATASGNGQRWELDPAASPEREAASPEREAPSPEWEAPSPDAVRPSVAPTPGIASIGSTHLALEPDPAAWIEPILVRASRFLPSISEAPIRGVRACARPLSDDGRPLVGMVPGKRNLFVCAGHGPWGISTGPASARMVTDLVLGRDPAIPEELDPARFGAPGG